MACDLLCILAISIGAALILVILLLIVAFIIVRRRRRRRRKFKPRATTKRKGPMLQLTTTNELLFNHNGVPAKTETTTTTTTLDAGVPFTAVSKEAHDDRHELHQSVKKEHQHQQQRSSSPGKKVAHISSRRQWQKKPTTAAAGPDEKQQPQQQQPAATIQTKVQESKELGEHELLMRTTFAAYRPLIGEGDVAPLFCPKSQLERDYEPATAESKAQLRERKHHILREYKLKAKSAKKRGTRAQFGTPSKSTRSTVGCVSSEVSMEGAATR